MPMSRKLGFENGILKEQNPDEEDEQETEEDNT